MQELPGRNIENVDDPVYGPAGQVLPVRALCREHVGPVRLRARHVSCWLQLSLAGQQTAPVTAAAANGQPAPRRTTGWKSQRKSDRGQRAKFPYICNTENEFSSRVQGIFLFPTFHTENVHFPHVGSCGQILGIRREGQSPGVH